MEVVGVFIVLIFFVALGALYFMYVSDQGRKNERPSTDPGLVKAKWQEVKAMMDLGGPASYRQAIIEADKLVDYVLKSRVDGQTMGERLKNGKSLFSKEVYDALWIAHKIRNMVVHEADFEGLSSDARLAVRGFEAALKELHAL